MSLNEIQLTRDPCGRLPFLTNWSRHEVASIKNPWVTDHWCKTKHKQMTFFTTDKEKTTNFFPGEFMSHELSAKKEGEDSITPHHRIDYGTIKHIGTISFTQMLHEDLNGQMPGVTSKRNPSKKLLKTKANTRAKENFEFWFKDPEPMKHSQAKKLSFNQSEKPIQLYSVDKWNLYYLSYQTQNKNTHFIFSQRV